MGISRSSHLALLTINPVPKGVLEPSPLKSSFYLTININI